MNLRLGAWSRRFAPGFSWCYRCKTPWRFVTPHSTEYIVATMEHAGHGCFPLCEKCWAALVPAERLPYYRLLVREWTMQGSHVDADKWAAIKAAVLEGR